jgi:hypothetical protein
MLLSTVAEACREFDPEPIQPLIFSFAFIG